MSISKTISKIRHKKNIPIRHLTQDHMSQSTYIRFIEGKTNISALNFLVIINKLNINLEEFNYINNNYTNPCYEFKNKLQFAILHKDINKLLYLRNKLKLKSKKYKSFKFNKYFHLYCIVNLFIEHINHTRIKDKYIYPIKEYLLSRYTWSYYELTLFNDSFFALKPNIIKIFLHRVIRNLFYYNQFKDNKDECIRLLTNATILFINRKEIKEAFQISYDFSKIKLQENMILEKLLIKYIRGLLLVIKGNNEGFSLIKQSLICFKITNPTSYYPVYERNYKHVLKLYKIHDNLRN